MSCPRCRQRVPRRCVGCGDTLPFGWPTGQCSDCLDVLSDEQDMSPAETLSEALLMAAEHPENTAVRKYLDLCRKNAKVASNLGELVYDYDEVG